MGTDQMREVSHEGDLMVLRPPLRAYAGRQPEQRVLYWERISDVDGWAYAGESALMRAPAPGRRPIER